MFQDTKILTSSISEMKAFKALQEKGAEIFLVGGIVRDFFLQKDSKDIDLLVRLLSVKEIVKTLSPFGEVMVEVGKSFGVMKFIPHGWESEPIDIALPRTETKIGEGHQDFEVKSDPFLPVEMDLKRRDITINAIALKLDGTIIDPFGGISDLHCGIIRAVSDTSFIEDPLRSLRVIQFAARFGFTVEPITFELIRKNAHLIQHISGERIVGELDKIVLKKGDISIAFDLIEKTDIWQHILTKSDLLGVSLRHIHKSFGSIKEMSRIDFYFCLLSILPEPSDFFRKRLKGDLETIHGLKALKMLSGLSDDATVFQKRMMLSKMKATSSIIFTSKIAQLFLSSEIDEVVSGMFPVSISELAVTGDVLKTELGFKEGKELGLKLKELFEDVLSERRKNTVEDLLR